MPLPYEVRKDLILPQDTFNDDGLAVIIANGSRYGGHWSISAFRNDASPSEESKLGEIWTERHEDPSMAFDTALIWANDAAVRADNGLIHAENLNHMYPPDQAPFFMLGRFVVGNAQYIDSLPPTPQQ